MRLLAHATMEPPNALIDLRSKARPARGLAAKPRRRVPHDPCDDRDCRPDIEIRLPRVGGGFGRGLQNDFVAEAVLVAQSVKAPVKLIWTREDDLQKRFLPAFGLHQLTATLDAQGRVSSWAHSGGRHARQVSGGGHGGGVRLGSDARFPMASRPAASRTTGQSLCRSNSVSRAAGCAGHCRRSPAFCGAELRGRGRERRPRGSSGPAARAPGRAAPSWRTATTADQNSIPDASPAC